MLKTGEKGIRNAIILLLYTPKICLILLQYTPTNCPVTTWLLVPSGVDKCNKKSTTTGVVSIQVEEQICLLKRYSERKQYAPTLLNAD